MLGRSLGWEDPLEEGVATHSRILAWRIPSTEEPGRLRSTGSQRVGTTETTHLVWALSVAFGFMAYPLCVQVLSSIYILLFILWLKKIDVCKKEESPLQLLMETHMDLELGYHHFGGEKIERRNVSQVTQWWVTEAELRPFVHVPQACRTQNWCLSLIVCTM